MKRIVRSGYVMKYIPASCKHEKPTWERIKVLDRFRAEEDKFMLELAGVIGDKKWIDLEKKRWAGCKPTGGTLTYQVVVGRPVREAVCVSHPRHKAVGFDGMTTYKVYL